MLERGYTLKIPYAFLTSCRPHHLNDGGGASFPCASSPSACGLLLPLPPQLPGHTWNFRENYGNLQEFENVNGEKPLQQRLCS